MTQYHATRGFWAEQFLLELAAPVNTHTIDAILAWMEGEGTKARNNPLATTKDWFRATPFNSAGVKNYPTFRIGMEATFVTISLKPYISLLAEIRKGTSAHAICKLIVSSPWGTQAVPLDAVLADPATYAAKKLYT